MDVTTLPSLPAFTFHLVNEKQETIEFAQKAAKKFTFHLVNEKRHIAQWLSYTISIHIPLS